MPKKLILTSFFIFFIIGLSFVSAKMLPCQAQINNCQAKPAATTLFDKKVSISDYSVESVTRALADHKRVILFFQASWCSTCYLIEQDLQTSASKIPNDVVISRVNIDVNKDLKTKYHVVAQDEMVQIDSNWMEKSHWKSSERAVEELLQNLK